MAHDIHGNSALNRELADDLAAFGYVVLMPDLFFDLEPEMVPDATGQPSPRYLGRFDRARCFGLFASGIEALRRRPECNGKVGVIGFCEGGNHALLSATRLRVDAAVSYYGTHIHTYLDEVYRIGCPMLLHLAEHDRTYADTERDRIVDRMRGAQGVQLFIYQAGHAFCRKSAKEYDPEAVRTAHARSFALFAKALA